MSGVQDLAERLLAAGESPPRAGRDPVNLPMIRNWLEALGDANPAYERDGVAPPAMIQVWTMRGLPPGVTAPEGEPGAGDPLGEMSVALDAAGFPNVVATDSEQEYHRPLRVGEQVSVRSRLESVTGPKRTSLGEGWFVTTRSTWFSGAEPVATMRFRILKYRNISGASRPDTAGLGTATDEGPATGEGPAAGGARAGVGGGAALRPVVTADTAFFWDGTAAGELRIQRCGECGALRHPPGPACPRCGALKQEHTVAAGTGTVHSFVVCHHPPVPGRRAPWTVGLIDLTEGVRMVGEVRSARPIAIGDPVRAEIVDGLPVWRPGVPVLEPLTLAVTPTLIISAALATRDLQDVHHDRDAAVRRGGRDIFLNILTTTGLVQRYVTDRLPGAVVRGVSIRLGTPCFAYDTLTFTGEVYPGGVVEVVGRTESGAHVTGKVQVST
nr:OB-fold domain-containing protein [Actinoplanes sp. DH11]